MSEIQSKDKMPNMNSTNVNNTTNLKKELVEMVSTYLASNPVVKKDRKENEMEIRFGINTREGKPISKIEYDNVIQYLYSEGFKCYNPKGTYYLRIHSEYTDSRTGITKMSNIRAEIVGVDMISEYCKSNSIQKIIDMPSTITSKMDKIKFTQKLPPLNSQNKPIKPISFFDHNYRVAYQMEQDFSIRSAVARDIINRWMDTKKNFRHMNRVRFTHPSLPFNVDLSIVRSSSKIGNVPVPQYTIQDASVFQNEPTYEIELEMDNAKIGAGTAYSTVEELMNAMRKVIHIVLSALQGSNYPITFSEQSQTLVSYMKLIHGDEYEQRKDTRMKPRDFIGPSSVSLQIENIVEQNENTNTPNVRSGYAVTEKADGLRKLLYVNGGGRVYLIDTNMNVAFTGVLLPNKALHNSLLDGEHIKHDKNGTFINLFAAFDIYYVNGKSVREFPFMKMDSDSLDNKYRLTLLNHFVEMMTAPQSKCDLTVVCKKFYANSGKETIFDICSLILASQKLGLFQYEVDGIIFTPVNLPMGVDQIGDACPTSKRTWMHSFKWKPPQYNTIDFLVTIDKNKEGKHTINTIVEPGTNMNESINLVQYKTLTLRCGFDVFSDGYINAFQSMLDIQKDDTPTDKKQRYQPVPFRPTTPYDANAHLCNIELNIDSNNQLFMRTVEGEYFEEDMIVEFSHNPDAPDGWKWKPLRVRYDKTAALRSGAFEYGNSYKTANSNWKSIYNPITEVMLSSGKNIPDMVDNDVYYYRSSRETNTQPLRDFHNLYVKRNLILGVSQRKNSLIDFAVGKGGDMNKWIDAKLGFVFGVDVMFDNINNNLNGACARYLDARKTHKNMFDGLFLHGNSGLNIRDGSAFKTDREKAIAKAVFGTGAKDRKILGELVYRHYGIGQEGFNVSSVQFALHYFFENEITLHNFLRNVADCTKVGGYFIGTCYDGKTVFDLLRDKMKGESITILRGTHRIFQITKQYTETGFPDDELSLGYAIDVYQESIGQEFREYLVNFDYFIRLMENYGFTLIPSEESQKMGIPNGSGMFSELYTSMMNEIKRTPKAAYNYRQASDLSEDEKRISFMNKYFVFRKTTHVNTLKIAKLLKPAEEESESSDEDIVSGIQKITKKMSKEKTQDRPTPMLRKLDHPKITIQQYDPVIVAPVAPEVPRLDTQPQQITADNVAPTAPVQFTGVKQTIKIRRPQ